MDKYSQISEYHRLCMEILSLSNKPVPRTKYFCSILEKIKHYTLCEHIELWFEEDGNFSVFIVDGSRARHDKSVPVIKKGNKSLPALNQDSCLNLLRLKVINSEFETDSYYVTPQGSFRINDVRNNYQVIEKLTGISQGKIQNEIHHNSFVIIPVNIGKDVAGIMQFMCNKDKNKDDKKIQILEHIAQILSIAVLNKRTQGALRERVKELSCLYQISQIAEQDDLTLESIMQKIADLIPPAWQYPEITIGQIKLDEKFFSSRGTLKEQHAQHADVIINGIKRGYVKTIYTITKPELDEGPFLKEERNLIDAIAKQIELIVERREAEQDKRALQEQIRHADRLATIGQLSAGVAHELNEPLGNILGFAQLLKKHENLTQQTENDIAKIIGASLHAREIIKKLMLFSRQMPQKTGLVNLNELVEQGLYFFEARCTKGGINLKRDLVKEMPVIEGDPGQLNQVLVNLVVNAIQAMPDGGDLVIRTNYDQDNTYLIVEDSGVGISDEIKDKIFLPFFTTKDVNEGTGLGLAVVHGIVMSHKGSINVNSELGKGSRFEIMYPLS